MHDFVILWRRFHLCAVKDLFLSCKSNANCSMPLEPWWLVAHARRPLRVQKVTMTSANAGVMQDRYSDMFFSPWLTDMLTSQMMQGSL